MNISNYIKCCHNTNSLFRQRAALLAASHLAEPYLYQPSETWGPGASAFHALCERAVTLQEAFPLATIYPINVRQDCWQPSPSLTLTCRCSRMWWRRDGAEVEVQRSSAVFDLWARSWRASLIASIVPSFISSRSDEYVLLTRQLNKLRGYLEYVKLVWALTKRYPSRSWDLFFLAGLFLLSLYRFVFSVGAISKKTILMPGRYPRWYCSK